MAASNETTLDATLKAGGVAFDTKGSFVFNNFQDFVNNAFNQDNYGRPVVLMNNPDCGRNLDNRGTRTITLSAK